MDLPQSRGLALTVLAAFASVYLWQAKWVCLPLVAGLLPSLALYRLWLYPKFLTPFKELPTPKPWHWLRGNCEDITEHTSVLLTRLAPPFYNEPVIRAYLPLNIEVLFATGPRALHELLTERAYHFIQPTIVKNIFHGLGIAGLLVTNGSHHKTTRRHLARVFSARNVRTYYPDFLDQGLEMVKSMEAEQSADKTVGIQEIVNRTTTRIVCATLFGYEYGSSRDEPDLGRIFWQFGDGRTLLACTQSFLPQNRIFDWFSSWSTQGQGLQELRQFALKLWENRKCGGRLDIISCMHQSGAFTKDQILEEVLTFLSTGFATTVMIMQWAIFALCKHRDIQQRLREEVRDRLPRPINEETRSDFQTAIESLPYLRAFCSEVLRHYPPLSLLIRQAACDTHLDGVYIPKGTILMVSPHVTNHNPELWGPTASSFNPDRWMEDDCGGPSGADTQSAFLTFGQGPRSCIGQLFIQRELLFLVALMSAGYEMELDDACKEVGLTGCVLLLPKDRIRIRLRALDGW